MASEIKWPGTETGVTLYFTVTNFLTGQKWNGSALEAYVVANWGNYDIALAESPAAGYEYVGTWPAALATPGFYLVDVFKQAGGSPAVIDRADLQGQMLGYWDGTYFKPVGVDVSQWAGTAVVAGAIPAAAADAAGGLPISDAGGLDLDAIYAGVRTRGAVGTNGDVILASHVFARVAISDESVGQIASGNITAGTYTVYRQRAAVVTEISTGNAWSKVNGAIYSSVEIDAVNFQHGDVAVVQSDGNTTVSVGGKTIYPAVTFQSWRVFGDVYTRLGAPAGASIAADLAAQGVKVGLLRLLAQNQLVIDWDNSIAYKMDDAGDPAYLCELTDAQTGEAVTSTTVAVNMTRWEAI